MDFVHSNSIPLCTGQKRSIHITISPNCALESKANFNSKANFGSKANCDISKANFDSKANFGHSKANFDYSKANRTGIEDEMAHIHQIHQQLGHLNIGTMARVARAGHISG
jgi:hypothetical protein